MEFINQYLGNMFPRRLSGSVKKVLADDFDIAKKKRLSKEKSPPESLTNAFAMLFNNGASALVASDRRVVRGFDLYSDSDVKIIQVSPFSALTYSGHVVVGDYVCEAIKNFSDLFFGQYGKHLTPDGQAKYIANCLQELADWGYLGSYPYYYDADPILIAFDLEFQKARIFFYLSTSPFNTYYHEKDFCGIGRGYGYIESVLQEKYKKEMSEREAISLAVLAMYHSAKQSIGVTDIRIALPSIAIIDEDEFRFLSEKQVKNCVNRVLKGHEGIVLKKTAKRRKKK